MTDHANPHHESSPRRLFRMLFGRRAGQIGGVIFLLLLAYLAGVRQVRFFMVPSRSMEPTLLQGDHLVTMNMARYQRGDIVVLREPEAGDYIVKRLVGLPGDEISVRNRALYVNGEYLSEPYTQELMNYQIVQPIPVPAGEVFVLGDNRNESEDSHITGTKSMKDIIGKVLFIYYPYARFGRVPSYNLEPVPMETAASGGFQQ